MDSISYTTVSPLEEVPDLLNEQGFAIIEDFRLSEETCETYKNEVWQALENIMEDENKILRDDVSTYQNYFKILPLHSMMLQHYGFGQLKSVWDAREKATPIFSYLWNVSEEQLLTSMDGISFHLAPENFQSERGKYKGNNWFHTDQSYLTHFGKCIQGFWNLEETGENDGCLSVYQGSNKLHQNFFDEFCQEQSQKELKDNWFKLNETQKNWYFEQGCVRRHVCPPKGCFVVWDSRTIHCGTEPRLPRENPRDRLVFYVCMLPKNQHENNGYYAKGITTAQLNKRIKCFTEGRISTHWPYPLKLFPKNPRTYGQEMPVIKNVGNTHVEDLSELQRSLLGI